MTSFTKAAPLVASVLLAASAFAEAPAMREHEGLPVVELRGAPYELGLQHGRLLGQQAKAMTQALLSYFRAQRRIPWLSRWSVDGQLRRVWRKSEPFLGEDILAELRGLSEGAGIPLDDLYKIHAIPDRTYSCAGFAAWNSATVGGTLVHLRNLDWSPDAGLQDYAAVFIVRPEGKIPYVNIGWAGFIGVLSGMNAERISVGQVGAETVDLDYHGRPMVFLLRDVLEQARNLDEAAAIIEHAPRTVGINYVFGDARRGKGIVIETTHSRARVFGANDPLERQVAYARPMADAVLRADTAMDPAIRERQLVSKGDPEKPGLEPPGGAAYEVRYVKQAEELRKVFGRIDAEEAKRIARAIAPDSNVQSVVYAWPEAWVANARNGKPAAQTEYIRLPVERWLR